MSESLENAAPIKRKLSRVAAALALAGGGAYIAVSRPGFPSYRTNLTPALLAQAHKVPERSTSDAPFEGLVDRANPGIEKNPSNVYEVIEYLIEDENRGYPLPRADKTYMVPVIRSVLHSSEEQQ